jgi:hypothetical protein
VHYYYYTTGVYCIAKMSAWFREVCAVKVGDIIGDKREILAVEASTPVGEVLDILKSENLISIAVYGTPGR